MAKCLYTGIECLLETKGKCGKAAKCPYAQKLMTKNGVKNLKEYFIKFTEEQARAAGVPGKSEVQGREPKRIAAMPSPSTTG
ncbi:MAG TPA: hypothetical protein DIT43_01315 [Dehalococcoidia bacterium]|nr:hypothetical protein [Dehalococcoidia bacterium]